MFTPEPTLENGNLPKVTSIGRSSPLFWTHFGQAPPNCNAALFAVWGQWFGGNYWAEFRRIPLVAGANGPNERNGSFLGKTRCLLRSRQSREVPCVN